MQYFLEYLKNLHNYYNIKYFFQNILYITSKIFILKERGNARSANTEAWRPFRKAYRVPPFQFIESVRW